MRGCLESLRQAAAARGGGNIKTRRTAITVAESSRSHAVLRASISPISSPSHPTRRTHLTTSNPTPPSSKSTTPTTTLSPRWLSDVKTRIGKCMTFGLNRLQNVEAAKIIGEIAQDWRELLAGSEGFLTAPSRRGLFRQKVVWGEQDAMGHVNNVMYNRYAESGRVEWTLRYAESIDPAHADVWRNLVTPTGDGLILRAITTNFKFPMRYPDRITVYHKLSSEPKAGSDTFLFDVLILSEKHQRIAARVTEDCALYDYRRGRKTAMASWMVDVLAETWRLQELAREENSKRVGGLLGRVRELELESWDREGAVENMGSAGS